MYRHVLVAIDGSHTSDMALGEAIRLAKDQGARLLIVHAVDETIVPWGAEYIDPTDFWKFTVQSWREILDKATAAVAAAGLSAETKLIEIKTPGRRIPEVIAAEADAWPADIIVAGTHGRHGLSHVFIGSIAEGIIRVATKPVLLIREK